MCATIHMYIDRLKDYQLPFKGSCECSGLSAHLLFGFIVSELHTHTQIKICMYLQSYCKGTRIQIRNDERAA